MAPEDEFSSSDEPAKQIHAGELDGMELAQSQVLHILETIADAFITLNQQGQITYINRAALQLMHTTQAELIGRSLWDDESTPFFSLLRESELRRAIAEQVAVEFEGYSPVLAIWLKVLAYPSPNGLFVHLQDISETKRTQMLHKQNEIRLQEHQHLLQQVTDTLPGILYVYDLQEQRNVYITEPLCTESA